jgi:multidrug efflux pump subunit AcrA (membrane-fusion protein)
VRISLKQPPPAMRLGSTVTGRVSVAGTPAIEVPPSAVVRGGREPAVWIVDPKTETVSPRPIQVRSSDPNRVEVASGLAPGDIVVTAGVQALRPGQKVRLLKSAP